MSVILGEVATGAKSEHVVGTISVDTGIIVIARAALSHHVLVPRVPDALTALRKRVGKAPAAELKVPKLGKAGAVVAVTPGKYDVMFGATKLARWCRVKAKKIH